MILNEIIQTKFIDKTKNLNYTGKRLDDISYKRRKDIANKNYDSGMFSLVRPYEKDPHMVVKIKIDPDVKDKFYDYVKLINGIAADNPYFLRIYKVITRRDKDTGHEDKMAVIEKLTNIESISIEEQDIIADRIIDFSKVSQEEIEETMANFVGLSTNTKISSKLVFAVAQGLIFFRTQKNEFIKDKLFLNALNILHHDKYALLDFHLNNLMIRKYKYGNQLVIVDPFSL